jgi:hypothetical protein
LPSVAPVVVGLEDVNRAAIHILRALETGAETMFSVSFRAGVRLAQAAAICAPIALAASAVRAETIDVYDNHGGRVAEYDQRWAENARRGVSVRITGPCQSACTVLLGHIPRSRICVTSEARFGFHLAKLPQATARLWSAYPGDIKAWINAHGGLQADFVWMGAPDVFKYFRRCA